MAKKLRVGLESLEARVSALEGHGAKKTPAPAAPLVSVEFLESLTPFLEQFTHDCIEYDVPIPDFIDRNRNRMPCELTELLSGYGEAFRLAYLHGCSPVDAERTAGDWKPAPDGWTPPVDDPTEHTEMAPVEPLAMEAGKVTTETQSSADKPRVAVPRSIAFSLHPTVAEMEAGGENTDPPPCVIRPANGPDEDDDEFYAQRLVRRREELTHRLIQGF